MSWIICHWTSKTMAVHRIVIKSYCLFILLMTAFFHLSLLKFFYAIKEIHNELTSSFLIASALDFFAFFHGQQTSMV